MENQEIAVANGFGAIKFENGNTSKTQVSFRYTYKNEYDNKSKIFSIEEVAPGPIKAHDTLTGEEDGAFWAVDEDKQCWVEDSTTGMVIPISYHDLIKKIEDWTIRNKVRECLAKKLEFPNFMSEALKYGFALPEGFNLNHYDHELESLVDRALLVPGFEAKTTWDYKTDKTEVDQSQVIWRDGKDRLVFGLWSRKVPGRIVARGQVYMNFGGSQSGDVEWAIDDNRQVWLQTERRDALRPVTTSFFLKKVDRLNHGEVNRVRAALGLLKKLCETDKSYLKRGWTPPADFKLEEYDLEELDNE